eukprot:scaffold20873_cov50-Skeletonema_dohrnii-CCMP3373.AAC.1
MDYEPGHVPHEGVKVRRAVGIMVIDAVLAQRPCAGHLRWRPHLVCFSKRYLFLREPRGNQYLRAFGQKPPPPENLHVKICLFGTTVSSPTSSIPSDFSFIMTKSDTTSSASAARTKRAAARAATTTASAIAAAGGLQHSPAAKSRNRKDKHKQKNRPDAPAAAPVSSIRGSKNGMTDNDPPDAMVEHSDSPLRGRKLETQFPSEDPAAYEGGGKEVTASNDDDEAMSETVSNEDDSPAPPPPPARSVLRKGKYSSAHENNTSEEEPIEDVMAAFDVTNYKDILPNVDVAPQREEAPTLGPATGMYMAFNIMKPDKTEKREPGTRARECLDVLLGLITSSALDPDAKIGPLKSNTGLPDLQRGFCEVDAKSFLVCQPGFQ